MKTIINVHTKKLLADLQTPVGIYLKIRDIYPESALLESSDYHSDDNSYSLVGVKAIASFKVQKEQIIKEYPCGSVQAEDLTKSTKLTTVFQSYLKDFDVRGDNPTGLNGFMGYTSYDAIRYFEDVDPINTTLENADVPEFYYNLYHFIIVINHLKNELTII